MSPQPDEPTRIELLELDIDVRLPLLWREMLEIEKWDLESASACVRAAFGYGYFQAMTDPDPERFFREHGYRVPERRTK